jgi:hypothetical protein
MIQPGNYDITIQQSGDFDATFQLKDSNGSGISLAGSTVEAELWTDGKKAKLADFTVTMIDASIGKFKITLTDTQTATLLQSGYYDVRVTDAAGVSYYWVRGQAILEVGYTE